MRKIAVMPVVLGAGAAHAGGYKAPVEDGGVVVVTPPPKGEPVRAEDWFAEGWELDADGHWHKDRAVVGVVVGGAVTIGGRGPKTGALVGAESAGAIMDCDDCGPDPEEATEGEDPISAPVPAPMPAPTAQPSAAPAVMPPAAAPHRDETDRDEAKPAAAPRPIQMTAPGGKETWAYAAPASDARRLGRIPPGTRLRAEPTENPLWLRVRLKDGGVAYLPAGTLLLAPGERAGVTD